MINRLAIERVLRMTDDFPFMQTDETCSLCGRAAQECEHNVDMDAHWGRNPTDLMDPS